MTECLACGRVDQLWLCTRCTQDLAATLRKLPALLVHLAESATGQTRLGGDGGRHTRSGPRMLHGDDSALAKCTCGHKWHEAECAECGCQAYDGVPNPAALQRSLLAIGRVNARASQLQSTIRNSLTTIVRDLCETRQMTILWTEWITLPTRVVEDGLRDGWLHYQPVTPSTSDVARWLSGYVDAIAADESAGVWFREIDGHAKAIEAVIDRPAPPRFVGPCIASHTCTPKCPTPCRRRDQWCDIALKAPVEAIEVTCPDCQATHNISRLQAVAKKRAEALRFTYEQLREILESEEPEFPRQTLHSWVKRGQLKPSGYRRPNGRIGGMRHSDQDEPVYRLADAKALRAKSRKVKAG